MKDSKSETSLRDNTVSISVSNCLSDVDGVTTRISQRTEPSHGLQSWIFPLSEPPLDMLGFGLFDSVLCGTIIGCSEFLLMSGTSPFCKCFGNEFSGGSILLLLSVADGINLMLDNDFSPIIFESRLCNSVGKGLSPSYLKAQSRQTLWQSVIRSLADSRYSK